MEFDGKVMHVKEVGDFQTVSNSSRVELLPKLPGPCRAVSLELRKSCREAIWQAQSPNRGHALRKRLRMKHIKTKSVFERLNILSQPALRKQTVSFSPLFMKLTSQGHWNHNFT